MAEPTTETALVPHEPTGLVEIDRAVTPKQRETLRRLLMDKDASGLKPDELVWFNSWICERYGLDPWSCPVQFILLWNPKLRREILTPYYGKEAAEQLRSKHNVSITDLVESEDKERGIFSVKAFARMPDGRTDVAFGRLSLVKKAYTDKSTGERVEAGPLKGDDLANALMKCETKAKNRVTYSILKMGRFMDETEAETLPKPPLDVVAKPTNGGEKPPRPSLAATMQRKPAAAPPVNPAPSESPSTVRPLQNAQTGLEGAVAPSGEQADLDYDALGPEPEGYTPDEVSALDVIGREIERVKTLGELDELWRTHKPVRDRMGAEAANELRSRFKVRGDELKGV